LSYILSRFSKLLAARESRNSRVHGRVLIVVEWVVLLVLMIDVEWFIGRFSESLKRSVV